MAAAVPDRALGVLDQARALLGPAVVPELTGAEADDDAAMEEHVDRALMAVRAPARSYDGPDALEVVRLAYDLTNLAWEQHRRVMDRRVAGLSAVQQAL